MRRKFGGRVRHALPLAGMDAGVRAIFAVQPCCETAAHTSSQSKLEANLFGWNSNRVFCFLFFSPPQLCSQPGTSHTTQIFSQPGILTSRHCRAGWRAGMLGMEPPALFSSSSNSFNKLLLLPNEWRASVVLWWWKQSAFPAWLQGKFATVF